ALCCRDLRAATQRADLLQALGENVVELGDASPLQQHVPVRARWLDLLLLRLRAIDETCDATVELALPRDRHLGVDRERHLELVSLGAQVIASLTRRQLGVAVGLVAHGSEAASAQHALAHDRLSPLGRQSRFTCANDRGGRWIPERGPPPGPALAGSRPTRVAASDTK